MNSDWVETMTNGIFERSQNRQNSQNRPDRKKEIAFLLTAYLAYRAGSESADNSAAYLAYHRRIPPPDFSKKNFPRLALAGTESIVR